MKTSKEMVEDDDLSVKTIVEPILQNTFSWTDGETLNPSRLQVIFSKWFNGVIIILQQKKKKSN